MDQIKTIMVIYVAHTIGGPAGHVTPRFLSAGVGICCVLFDVYIANTLNFSRLI